MGEWIFRIVIAVVLALWSAWGLPYLKAKIGAEQAAKVAQCVKTAVQAAEQLLRNADGKSKYEFVCQSLSEQGINVTESVKLAVEAEVANLPHSK